MRINPKLIPSRSALVAPELKLEIISAGRLTLIRIRPAATASIPINMRKIGIANIKDVM
jgi:hypothetical protein